jgi:hypothetical protein
MGCAFRRAQDWSRRDWNGGIHSRPSFIVWLISSLSPPRTNVLQGDLVIAARVSPALAMSRVEIIRAIQSARSARTSRNALALPHVFCPTMPEALPVMVKR